MIVIVIRVIVTPDRNPLILRPRRQMGFVLEGPVVVSPFVMRVPVRNRDPRNREIPERREKKRYCSARCSTSHRSTRYGRG